MNRIRISRVKKKLRELSLDFAIVTSSENICYLTGYSPYCGGPNCVLVPSQGEITFIANSGEEQAVRKLGCTNVISYQSFSSAEKIESAKALVDAIGKVLAGKRLRLGIETNELSVRTERLLVNAIEPKSTIDVSSIFLQLRAVKDKKDLDMIRKSIELAEIGVETMLEHAHAGATEISVFSKLKERMETEAGKPIDMYTDLVSGEKCLGIGYPVAVASKKPMRVGEDVICDVLVKRDGYFGDLTRTKHLGHRSSRQKDIYLAVKEAEIGAIKSVRPGVRACDIDMVARRILSEYGFKLSHYTGHGIGLHYREEPILARWNKLRLQPGMVLTTEPGVYVPKIGSVRLEDNILVTDTGHEVLSALPYEL